MNRDVYICYDDKQEEISEAICDLFKDNNIQSWIKSRDFPSNDADKIVNAIATSKCFVLILSNNSKNSNHIITETDIAFSRDIPILVFAIDELKLEGNLEFILETQTRISSFPNSKKQLETLVRKTSDIVGKPAGNVKIDSRYVSLFEKINPKRRENNVKKYVKIAIPIAIVLVLIYLFVILPMGQNTTENGVFSMNVTGVDVNGLNYVVHGESFNLPGDADKYFMNIRFLDGNDNMIFEVNSTADEFKSGIIWQGNLPSGNATHVGFKLTDKGGKVLSKEDYKIK